MFYLRRIILFLWTFPFMYGTSTVFDYLSRIFPNPIFKIVALFICGLLGWCTGNHLFDYIEEEN